MDNSKSGSQPANKLAINAATICIYAIFDKNENASRSFGAALLLSQQCLVDVCDDNGANDFFLSFFCSFASLCYFTIVTVMTKNRAIAFGMRKWRRNEEEKSQTHMANTTKATHIYFKAEILFHVCVCAQWWVTL